MLLEKSSLSSILKEFLEFLEQQIHLVMCFSVLVRSFLFGLVTVSHIHPVAGRWAVLGCRGLWGPFHFPCGSPRPFYTRFSRGDANI